MNDPSTEHPDSNRLTAIARSRTHEAVAVVPAPADSGATPSCPQRRAAQLRAGGVRILVPVGSWCDALAEGNDSSSRRRSHVISERRRLDRRSLRRGRRHRGAAVPDLKRGVGSGPSGLFAGDPAARRRSAAHGRAEPRLRTGAPRSQCSGAIPRLV